MTDTVMLEVRRKERNRKRRRGERMDAVLLVRTRTRRRVHVRKRHRPELPFAKLVDRPAWRCGAKGLGWRWYQRAWPPAFTARHVQEKWERARSLRRIYRAHRKRMARRGT